MRRWQKISVGVMGALLLLVVVVAVIGFRAVRRPFPQTSGTIELDGLQDEVQVLRDEWGVPHIYAQNQTDLFFAQGYVHAQDRFWQMEFWRHVSQGRISEIAGQATLPQDEFIRTVGWNRMAEANLAYYQSEVPETYAVMEAYSAGVNAYIEDNRDALSLNITILTAVNEPWEIEPWQPVHTVGWALVMANDLTGSNMRDELNRAELINLMGAEQFAKLDMDYRFDDRPVIAPSDALIGKANTTTPDLSYLQQLNTNLIGQYPDGGYLGSGDAIGSNNWVIHGDLTESGLPLLANDPHLGIQMPSIWYEVGLHAPNFDVVGVSFAGVPGVIVGHNDRIAWGVTNVRPDNIDLFVERINPDNPNEYLFEDAWLPIETVEEVIKVNGGEDVVLTVRQTHHGPIINDVVDTSEDALAYRWSAQDRNLLLHSVLLLNEASDFAEFRDALSYWDIPSQNIVYADVDGNIGYQLPGLIPIRRSGTGDYPVPGWTGEYEWEGWVPYDELPSMFNPPSGYIATANQSPVDEAYPYYLGGRWADGDRGQRIVDMIENTTTPFTPADMGRIQTDNHSLFADDFVPLLATITPASELEQDALAQLQNWDGQVSVDSVGGALSEIFRWQLALALFADDVGEEHVSFVAHRTVLYEVGLDASAEWWDDVTTAEVESREDILQQAWSGTVAWFEQAVGRDVSAWTWGTIHQGTFVSNPVGQSGVAFIENIVNRGPMPVSGSSSIVNANGWSWSNPADVTGHVSMRMITDLSDFDNSLLVLPTGQSGHPFNPHYDDMMPLWLDGTFHPMRWSKSAVESANVDTLVLQPKE